MNGGRLLQVDAPARIYREPADAFVARFIGAAAVMPGIAGNGRVKVGALDLPARAAAALPPGSGVELFLRPEHVRVVLMNGHIPPDMVGAEVVEATFLGSLTRLRLRFIDHQPEVSPVWADVPSEDAEPFRPGVRVLASWHEAAPRVLASG